MAIKLPEGFELVDLGSIDEISVIHNAREEKFLQPIIQNGFNFRRFGATAKAFGMQDFMKHDPVGIFGCDYNNHNVQPGEPYVAFKLLKNGLGLVHGESNGSAKEKLWNFFEAADHMDLTKKLKKIGVNVVFDKDFTSEIIVLNTKSIQIFEAGLYNEKTFPIQDSGYSLT